MNVEMVREALVLTAVSGLVVTSSAAAYTVTRPNGQVRPVATAWAEASLEPLPHEAGIVLNTNRRDVAGACYGNSACTSPEWPSIYLDPRDGSVRCDVLPRAGSPLRIHAPDGCQPCSLPRARSHPAEAPVARGSERPRRAVRRGLRLLLARTRASVAADADQGQQPDQRSVRVLTDGTPASADLPLAQEVSGRDSLASSRSGTLPRVRRGSTRQRRRNPRGRR
jgi:hypothetical protein